LKLTIFGLTISSSWGNGHATPYRAVLRSLHRLGHQVTFYEKDVEYYRHRRDFRQCDYCELVLYSEWPQVRGQALASAAVSDAVIVGSYCPKGAQIGDEVLALGGPLRVFYDLDTPITLANLASGDLDYLRRDQMSAFDLYLSFTGGGILETLEQDWGVRRAVALYGCVDPEVHARVSRRDQFGCDLSYMGTYAADRQQKLDEFFLEPARRLSKARFILAGSLYPRQMATSWPENVRVFEHVAPANHPALYSSSQATLNITRDGMARTGYCPSGRFFEAAACGTPILSDWFEGLGSFFAPGEEIFVVHNADEVIAAMKCPESELARLAARARRRTLEEHTGECRARQLLEYLHEARWLQTRRTEPERLQLAS